MEKIVLILTALACFLLAGKISHVALYFHYPLLRQSYIQGGGYRKYISYLTALTGQAEISFKTELGSKQLKSINIRSLLQTCTVNETAKNVFFAPFFQVISSSKMVAMIYIDRS